MESEIQVAIVTGGSRGIGRAVVEALLGTGWRVHFCSQSAESVAAAGAALGERFPGKVAGRVVDVRRQPAVDAYVQDVANAEGRLDLLVNNAGLGIFGPVDELSGDDFRCVVETNLMGCFYFLRAAAAVMKPRGRGWIVNVASLAGKNAMLGGAAYNASKFGLVGMSEAAMLDLRPHGIRVAALLPGSVETDFSHPTGHSGTHPVGASGTHPVGASGGPGGTSWRLQPRDIAAMVLHLLTYPDNALPSLVEMRPSRPPQR